MNCLAVSAYLSFDTNNKIRDMFIEKLSIEKKLQSETLIGEK